MLKAEFGQSFVTVPGAPLGCTWSHNHARVQFAIVLGIEQTDSD